MDQKTFWWLGVFFCGGSSRIDINIWMLLTVNLFVLIKQNTKLTKETNHSPHVSVYASAELEILVLKLWVSHARTYVNRRAFENTV